VYRIAYNGAMNRLQRRKFQQPLLEQDITGPGPAPDAWVEDRERSAALNRALALLDHKYRVQLVLRHFLDLSYAEIADITNLPLTTVRSRLHTARVLLREELRPGAGAGARSRGTR
jgi:RNA polymerase sigma-70 factor (ECF subfamily)